jgi:hypothetical protein
MAASWMVALPYKLFDLGIDQVDGELDLHTGSGYAISQYLAVRHSVSAVDF